ncbi:MAG: bifunctional adenosylcobinamide kinase/adenosylcobinamide-phosphate guanylyltransferase [Tissierellia bacterium]|nr:bifunctional adenosylcobinamide kinase/adenosylcobinamide-phosphate guanylyltransferase [Tissierellia bacterium]
MIKLITGGIRSGKSNFAQNLLKTKDVCYIATSKVEDEEMKARVKKHIESRPKDWRTFEDYKNLQRAVGLEENYILECLGNLCSNILYDITKDMEKIDSETQKLVEDLIFEEIFKLIKKIKSENKNLIIVTNEVGQTLVPINHLSRVYTDILGRTNQRVGNLADSIYLVVCGAGIKIK